ncbi:MAG: outer membrane protein assembly factor BamD, partial [Pseudomonadota bacterium]
MKKALRAFSLIVFTSFTLSGCSLYKLYQNYQSDIVYKDWSTEQLYEEGRQAMQDKDYGRAIQLYEILEAKVPLSENMKRQINLDIIYAYYKFNEPESALVEIVRFVNRYPGYPQMDYVYYLRGMIHFDMGASWLDRYVTVVDMSERSQSSALRAFRSFERLLNRYPKSEYAADARQRMIYLRNNLAKYELHVADFYMRRGAYLAAARRAQYVVERYQGAPSMP